MLSSLLQVHLEQWKEKDLKKLGSQYKIPKYYILRKTELIQELLIFILKDPLPYQIFQKT